MNVDGVHLHFVEQFDTGRRDSANQPVPDYRVVGAGDAVVAVLTLTQACGLSQRQVNDLARGLVYATPQATLAALEKLDPPARDRGPSFAPQPEPVIRRRPEPANRSSAWRGSATNGMTLLRPNNTRSLAYSLQSRCPMLIHLPLVRFFWPA